MEFETPTSFRAGHPPIARPAAGGTSSCGLKYQSGFATSIHLLVPPPHTTDAISCARSSMSPTAPSARGSAARGTKVPADRFRSRSTPVHYRHAHHLDGPSKFWDRARGSRRGVHEDRRRRPLPESARASLDCRSPAGQTSRPPSRTARDRKGSWAAGVCLL